MRRPCQIDKARRKSLSEFAVNPSPINSWRIYEYEEIDSAFVGSVRTALEAPDDDSIGALPLSARLGSAGANHRQRDPARRGEGRKRRRSGERHSDPHQ